MRRNLQAEDRMDDGQPTSRRNLVDVVGEQLRREIASGNLTPGEKLPSESGLTEQYKVSRTVIREAIASMRADGLVEVRHGVGVFVRSVRPLHAGLLAADPGRISSIIEMLELRAAVETEAAGLAALRRSPAQEETILRCLQAFDAAIAGGLPTADADFRFHLAIADATGNPRFREFLDLTGQKMIPRSSLQDDATEVAPAAYLAQIQDEHRQIADAISDRDETAAREAMRLHLKGSQQRYRNLIRKAS